MFYFVTVMVGIGVCKIFSIISMENPSLSISSEFC